MDMSKRRFVVWHSMKNEYGQCSWSLDDNLLTVVTAHGKKATQLCWHPPDLLARILMREIASENAPGQTE
jgi:hypothetical protein